MTNIVLIQEPKTTYDVLDYSFDWSAWLVSDTIATSIWEVPAGLTEESESETSEVTTIWLSGGTPGISYVVKNRITTAGGRSKELAFLLPIC
jgi:hypothetical protein